MIERKVTIAIPCGMHIHPASILSEAAGKYQAKTRIIFKYHEINTSSILNIVASGINCGDEVIVRCDGIDEADAMDGVTAVLRDTTIHL